MMEAMYEADAARQLEEDKSRKMTYVGASEKHKMDSGKESDHRLGKYDTEPSYVRAVGDEYDQMKVNSDLLTKGQANCC